MSKILVLEDDADMRELAEEEVTALKAERKSIEEELTTLLLPSDPNDSRNIVVEIRAGTGGDEAALFVSDLFRMYQRFADSRGWNFDVLSPMWRETIHHYYLRVS